MPTFCYKARDKENKLVEGSVEDFTIDDAFNKLKGLELFPVDIQTNYADLHKDPQTQSRTGINSLRQNLIPRSQVSGLTVFTRRLADLMSLKLPLIETLEQSAQNTSRELKKTASNLALDIISGSTLEASLLKYPHVFGAFYASSLRPRSSNERLYTSISLMAEYLENKKSLISRWKAHYYLFLIIMYLIPVFLAASLYTLVPYFGKVSISAGITLSPLADVVFRLSQNTNSEIYLTAVVAIPLAIILIVSSAPEKIRIIFDKLLTFIPVAGKCIQTLNCALFSRAVEFSLGRGHGINDVIQYTISEVKNSAYIREVKALGNYIKSGKSLYVSLNTSKLFPESLGKMLSSEATHDEIIKAFQMASGYFSREFSHQLFRFRLILLYPAIIIAFLVLFFVPALFFTIGF